MKIGEHGPEVVPETVDIEEGEPLKLEIEAFYRACLGEGEDYVTWAEGLEAMRVADLVQKAVAESLAAMLEA